MTFAFPWILWFLPLSLYLLRKLKLNAIKVSSLAGWEGAQEPQRARWIKLLNILRTAACALLIIAILIAIAAAVGALIWWFMAS